MMLYGLAHVAETMSAPRNNKRPMEIDSPQSALHADQVVRHMFSEPEPSPGSLRLDPEQRNFKSSDTVIKMIIITITVITIIIYEYYISKAASLAHHQQEPLKQLCELHPRACELGEKFRKSLG